MKQGRWIASEAFEYCRSFDEAEVLFAFSACFKWALYVTGFQMNSIHVPPDDRDRTTPGDFLELLERPILEERHSY